jgi:hypothetical protein
MYKQAQYTEKRTIAQPEIDLEHGKPDAKLTAIRQLWALALLIIAGAAAGSLGWVWPRYEYDWNWGRFVGSSLLVLIGAGALTEAVRTYRALRFDENEYRCYLADRRSAHLEALAQHAGQNIERQMTTTEIKLNHFSDIVRLIVFVKLNNKATIAELTGPLMLSTARRSISLGSASKYTAELAAQELERIGVLEHNGEGRARTVSDEPLETLIWRAADRWGRA